MTLHPASHADTIFVQVASYRDPELLPTLVDLIRRSAKPARLRVVVCWQHADEQPLAAFWQRGFGKWRVERADGWNVHHLDFLGAKIELIDVPHFATQGACWARNLIQQRYGGERYTLQLDSHHRFVDRWDATLVQMLESLRAHSAKPLLTAYLPSYDPADAAPPSLRGPLTIAFSHFDEQGIVLFRPKSPPDGEAPARPIPARFYSAHFAFADGHFADTVQHDPDYFFLGEEISIAVRAFTHGYDLYHPHVVLAWHEYTRKQRVKVWDDHSVDAQRQGRVSQPWGERNRRAMQRNLELFGVDGHPLSAARFNRYGFGIERTVADYEAYAGLCFACRGVSQAALDNLAPMPGATRPASDDAWKASLLRSRTVRIREGRDAFDRGASAAGARHPLGAARRIRVAVHDAAGVELHREMLDQRMLGRHRNDDRLDFRAVFASTAERVPARYAVELLDDAGEVLSRVEKTLDA